MNIIRDPQVMHEWAQNSIKSSLKVALIPTMGALHNGHLSLINLAKNFAEKIVVSLFINPSQFDDVCDFEKYPKTIENDKLSCEKLGVDILFIPSSECMYLSDHSVWIDEFKLSNDLCGQYRPNHFRGVCTIVLKLINIVQCNFLLLGEKDAQQLRIIERMLRDLNIPVKIIRGKTIRESDGLALSSRNTRLSKEARKEACKIYESIKLAEGLFQNGERLSDVLIYEVRNYLSKIKDISIDYVCIVDNLTLTKIDIISSPALLAIAVKIESVRLIDNTVLEKN